MTSDNNVLNATKQWLADFVIELNLCPFAKREFVSKSIRFVVSEANQEVELLDALQTEINYLITHKDVSTTLLIHPRLLNDFGAYNQFLDIAEGLLEQQNWLGEFQLASFHPDYRFANTTFEDAENFTNRSPFPMLHVLREEQIEKAISAYPDIEKVPVNNIQLMKDIGSKELECRLKALITTL